jgi:hypothetical protein
MAQYRLGHLQAARSALRRLREVMKNPQWARSGQAQALFREAETAELDQVFPPDPFAL